MPNYSGMWTSRQQLQALGAGYWPGLSFPDAQFNYVTMLLPGNGTNGAQNNTFLDSSTNNFLITRNGNTTQGSFSPYGSNWSNYFGGSSYLSASSNAAFEPSTGDFTCEAWINISVLPSSGGLASICQNDAVGVSNNTKFYFGVVNTAGTLQLVLGRHDTANRAFVNWTPTVGVWYHVAAVRQSGTVKLFIDGVSQTVTGSTDLSGVSFSQNGFTVGAVSTPAYMNGYISNFRYVVGTAVYTASFTPSTTPLTAITNTVFLTCQSNRFVDNSASPKTITATGTPSVQRFNPFGTSTAYSRATIGGSGYFNGSTSYLSTPSTNIPTALWYGAAFTLEYWIYPLAFGGTSNSANYSNVIGWGDASGVGEAFDFGPNASGTVVAYYYNGGQVYQPSSTAIKLNTWSCLAITGSNGTMTMYVNGVSVGSWTKVGAPSDGLNFLVGGIANGRFNGYLSDVRVSNVVRTITVPTAPLTSDANTVCLLNSTNAGIYDNAMMNDLETVGNAQISTSVVKYGTGSMAFDGSGDYLYIPNTPSLRLSSTGAFTIEFWVNPSALSSDQHVIHAYSASSPFQGWAFGFGSGGVANTSLGFYDGSSWRTVGTGFSTGTWYHIAVSSEGLSSTGRLFLNGVQQGASFSVSSSIANSATPIAIGAQYTGSFPFNGYIDDLRITNGFARYTANFAPPSTAFPTFGPV